MSEKERRNKPNKKTDTKIRIAANMLVLVKEEKKTRHCYCMYIAVCIRNEPSSVHVRVEKNVGKNQVSEKTSNFTILPTFLMQLLIFSFIFSLNFLLLIKVVTRKYLPFFCLINLNIEYYNPYNATLSFCLFSFKNAFSAWCFGQIYFPEFFAIFCLSASLRFTLISLETTYLNDCLGATAFILPFWGFIYQRVIAKRSVRLENQTCSVKTFSVFVQKWGYEFVEFRV